MKFNDLIIAGLRPSEIRQIVKQLGFSDEEPVPLNLPVILAEEGFGKFMLAIQPCGNCWLVKIDDADEEV